jgi:hypothetical protein
MAPENVVKFKKNKHIIEYHISINYYLTCLYYDFSRTDLNYITLTRKLFGGIGGNEDEFL